MSDVIFSHLVEIDETNKQVIIYRVFSNGGKQLYTKVDLPAKTVDEDKSSYENFSRMLGENILIDSPIARKIVGL